MTEPQNSMTAPVPPAVPILPMAWRIMSLSLTPWASSPSTCIRMFLLRRVMRHWVARTCSTSLVPMPKARDPKAPWVEVWLSPHTTVVLGRVKPCSGPDDVDNALPLIGQPEICDAKVLDVVLQGDALRSGVILFYEGRSALQRLAGGGGHILGICISNRCRKDPAEAQKRE